MKIQRVLIRITKAALIVNLVAFVSVYADVDGAQRLISQESSAATLTETELLSMLTPQGRSIYFSLTSEGKALAIQIASQNSDQNKDLAVLESQKRMNENYKYLNH